MKIPASLNKLESIFSYIIKEWSGLFRKKQSIVLLYRDPLKSFNIHGAVTYEKITNVNNNKTICQMMQAQMKNKSMELTKV